MQITANNPQAVIRQAIDAVDEMSPHQTDGAWLEDIAVAAGPHIRDWDIAECYHWADWPQRQAHFPGATKRDVGIDAVAVRRSDGAHIAIQCKARQLDADGKGDAIPKHEVDSFAHASVDDFWAERWIVTNGDNPITANVLQTASISRNPKPLKVVNIAADLRQQAAAFASDDDNAQPAADGEPPPQTKTSMQNEAVAESVRILQEHAKSHSGGLPPGQARGKIILPCGAGKTRISLRIVERLTPPGGLSIALCPSIALVAQLRREYLQQANTDIRALAVCSDETAGYDPKKESSRNTAADPTLDNSNVSASEVKGAVTTNAAEIAQWIQDGKDTQQISVIFGTYQSGHRIAEALQSGGASASVLIADEAHRTAGLRRKRKDDDNKRMRDFTLCHDNNAFPAKYRVYQTATPRIYDTRKPNRAKDKDDDWIVRTMDDSKTFGVELYRKSYIEAVQNGWLSDYRIIAVGVNDIDAYMKANELAQNTKSKGRSKLTTTNYLRGLAFALAMGGATQAPASDTAALNTGIPIKSCIAFMNTVDKSKNMAEDLQTPAVKQWVQDWLHDHAPDGAPKTAADYSLEHLDASSNVTARDNAKKKLADATEANPYGIINVGIFGEGTDSPELNAVAFLEARRSPIDVIQAVGRAMRKTADKRLGYLICPIQIPPNADPETWLSTSDDTEGWQELGQILRAMRAHDSRIEDELKDLLALYLPKPPEQQTTIVGIAKNEDKRISYRQHTGRPGDAQPAIERVLAGKSAMNQEFQPIADPPPPPTSAPAQSAEHADKPSTNSKQIAEPQAAAPYQTPTPPEPTQIMTGKNNFDGSIEIRMDTVVRNKPKTGEERGPVNIDKSKVKAKKMINNGEGVRVTPSQTPKQMRPTRQERAQTHMQALLLNEMADYGDAIKMNLLSKSGLNRNHTIRDLNLLRDSVEEAAYHLAADELQPALDDHFELNNLNRNDRVNPADGCTIAALLMMNAAMLHQRIANGNWFSDISELESVKNEVNVVARIRQEWERIMRYDFRPVLEPAVEAIYRIERTGKIVGLERALRHIAAEAQRIAEIYADMGADHAGELFNRVMGYQASDGAFFTKPVAASIAARLTLDALGATDWTNPATWRDTKILDPACGSGTLLAAILSDMKRRAQQQGATQATLNDLQRTAVQDAIKGLDINPVSLQLAASQLTAGNDDIRYRRMGLNRMPYGPDRNAPARVAAGSLELLGQKAIVARNGQFDIADDDIRSQAVWNQHAAPPELEDAVEAAQNARIVIMNPPFTNRAKMGEKFQKQLQQALRQRVDALEQALVKNDKPLKDFVDKNALAPLFVALADKCLSASKGVLTIVHPTITLTNPSGQDERIVLAQRYHIHTILTCHQPGQINISQNTNINESVIVAKRHAGPKPHTRFINLDRMPIDEAEVSDLHESLARCEQGAIPNGWGEVSYWTAERIQAGDWTAAIWRSPELANAAYSYANDDNLNAIAKIARTPWKTGAILPGSFEKAISDVPGSFPILKSKSSDSQTTIQAQPDEHWIPKNRDDEIRKLNGGTYPEVDKILRKAGHLLITSGQDSSAARLTAVASDDKYVGNGWMPITGLSPEQAKALAVFLNSTPGRLQLMRNFGRKLTFPLYNPAGIGNIRIPNIKDAAVRNELAACWELTRGMEVPQFRDGECAVRRQWDAAVASACGWDAGYLAHLRALLHAEPHVRGLGYAQYGEEVGAGDDAGAAVDGTDA